MSVLIIDGKPRRVDGWRPDRPDHRDLMFAAPPGIIVPDEAGLEEHCSRVEDQSHESSCVAHGVTDAMEWLQGFNGGPIVQLSRQFLYYEARRQSGIQPGEDGGCYIRDAVKVGTTTGVPAEALFPYVAGQYASAPPAAAYAQARDHRIPGYRRVRNLADLQACIGADKAHARPVVLGFSVPATMGDDSGGRRTGVIPLPDARGFVGGHCVFAVRYRKGFGVRIKNSWGTGWGEAGYGWLPEFYFDHGLVDDMWALVTEAVVCE